MAQKDLIPMSERSKEEVKAIAAKGGRNSGKARRNKAMLKDCLAALLEAKMRDEKTGKMLTGAELLAVDLYEKTLAEIDLAKKARAFDTIRDTAGQKPVDKVVIAEVDQTVIDEVEAMMDDDED